MLADEIQVENSDLLAKKNKSKLTVRPARDMGSATQQTDPFGSPAPLPC